MNNLIVLNENDNVGVSQFIIPEKTKIEGHEISTVDPIPFGHKVCLKTIKKGDPIIKYDQIIGFALDDIKPGQHVHSHNLEFREFKRDFKVTDKKHIVDEKADTFFNGILRDNGQVATRNYIGIVSTVNCSATVTKMIVEKIKYSENYAKEMFYGYHYFLEKYEAKGNKIAIAPIPNIGIGVAINDRLNRASKF